MAEKFLCGVDLGGTKLSAGLFTPKGETVDVLKVNDHLELGNDDMADRVAALLKDLLESRNLGFSDIEGIGVGVAAHCNSEEGMIITSSNFIKPFRKYPFRKRLQKTLGYPVIIDNDANAQALGEFMFGAGQGRKSVVFITVSTGVGTGIILEGRLHRGHSGFAGELGHSIIAASSGIHCTCGNIGCLMAVSGTLGLLERYHQCVERGMPSGIELNRIDRIDGMMLENLVKNGDKIATQLFQETADYLGMGIYNIYQIINPQTVILGGGLMNMGFNFMEKIEAKFRSMVHNMVHHELEIVQAGLGRQAGLLGAAALPLESRLGKGE